MQWYPSRWFVRNWTGPWTRCPQAALSTPSVALASTPQRYQVRPLGWGPLSARRNFPGDRFSSPASLLWAHANWGSAGYGQGAGVFSWCASPFPGRALLLHLLWGGAGGSLRPVRGAALGEKLPTGNTAGAGDQGSRPVSPYVSCSSPSLNGNERKG